MTLNFEPLTLKCKGTFLSHHPASMYEIWKLYVENYSSYCVRTKMCWQSSVVTLAFDPKMYRYLPFTILHLCIKYESCTLKTSQVIMSEPKCWQSSVVTLTFDLLTPKCIGIFLSSSCIYACNIKAVRWNYSSYRVRTNVLTKFRCDLWPFDPKMYRYLPLAILHLCMKYESCTLKTTRLSYRVRTKVLKDRRTDRQTWFL